MITWIKQILGLPRYFIVVYMYHLKSGVTGQGQCSAKVCGGVYLSVDEIIKLVEPNVGGEIKTFLMLNTIEINKRDYNFYQDNNKLTPIEDES